MHFGVTIPNNWGVEHILLALNPGDVSHITRLMADIARDVLPRFGRTPAA
jgi:hypothetical protein